MSKIKNLFATLTALGLGAGPALAHSGHGPESTIPGHLHGVPDLSLLVVALAGAGIVLAALYKRRASSTRKSSGR